jgi:hypothetical protein
MYQAGESRNYKYTLEHCALEDFRPHVHCYLPDVVQAYKCLIEHMPMFDDGAHHPLFLGPKHKLNPNKDKIWFLKINTRYVLVISPCFLWVRVFEIHLIACRKNCHFFFF